MDELFSCTAFHKADYCNAMISIRWQSFYASAGNRHWLGNGVYFWQRYEDAQWWPGRYSNPVILAAKLECRKDRFLDLDDKATRDDFYSYFENLSSELFKLGYDIRVSGDEIINGGSCNYFKEFFKIELIRYSFPSISNRPQLCATTSLIAHDIRLAAETSATYYGEL